MTVYSMYTYTDLMLTIPALLLNAYSYVNLLVIIYIYMLTRMIFLHKFNCGLFLCSKSLVRFTSNLWYLKIKGSFVTVIYLFACFFFFFFFYFVCFCKVCPMYRLV